MKNDLIKVGLRVGAFYIPNAPADNGPAYLKASTIHCLEEFFAHGYTLTEDALRAYNSLSPTEQADMLKVFAEVYNTECNWVPLVRNWHEPKNVDQDDIMLAIFANMVHETFPDIKIEDCTTLPCGHVIPNIAFDLSRYNGCPLCGQPFVVVPGSLRGQSKKLKPLRLWRKGDPERYLRDLLASTVPLDATHIDSLKILLNHFSLPAAVEIGMKETMVVVLEYLISLGREEEAASLMRTPTDILRYIWYRHTGQLQIIEPKTLIDTERTNYEHLCPFLDQSLERGVLMEDALKLHFTRPECRRYAQWLNSLPLAPEKSAQIMHPKRQMWVRVIRALRLSEFARKRGFEKLADLMDVFYNKQYIVPQGILDEARNRHDLPTVVDILSANPGLFARQLFSNMLYFGADRILADFKRICHKLPARLMLSLADAAEYYFLDSLNGRSVRTITGEAVNIPANPRLEKFPATARAQMADMVKEVVAGYFADKYSKMPPLGKKVYISEDLRYVPLPVGDRAKTVQDASSALQGTMFPVEGDDVRLFMHWGKGMKAAPIDMDLSAAIIYDDNSMNYCAYFNLDPPGAHHSGDIRKIPDYVGTAEYIELNIPVLRESSAKYVAFFANNYSGGKALTDTMLGWMTSDNPMKLDEKTGVAYDPSCVQYFVTVPSDLITRGILFGVLIVKESKIMWIEAETKGQTVTSISASTILNMIQRLQTKTNTYTLLHSLAKAQNLEVVSSLEEAKADPEGTIIFDLDWARDVPAVTSLLIP